MTEKKKSWCKLETEQLISIYEKFPVLYNSKHKDHFKARRKDAAYLEITRQLQEIKPNVSVQNVKSKIKTIKDQLAADRRNALKRRRLGINEVFKPRLWCYRYLHFLEDAMNESSTTSTSFHNDDFHVTQDDNNSTWIKQEVDELIKVYEKYPLLYDCNHQDFLKNQEREDAYADITQQLQEIKPNVSVSSVKKKIRMLKDQLCAEKRRMQTNEVYESKLRCCSNLKFLDSARDESHINSSCFGGDNLPVTPDDNKCTWSKQEVEKLIKIYKKYPLLYDCKHQDFVDNKKKEAAYADIIEKLQEMKPNVSVQSVKKKIKTLKDQLRADKRKATTQSGVENNKIYEPKLWCYRNLKFLDSTIDESNINSTSFDDDDFSRAHDDNKCIWSKQEVAELINIFEKYPLLYDSKHQDFMKNKKKDAALADITEQLRKVKSNVSVQNVRKKIKVLKDQMRQEKRKAMMQSYLNTDEVYEPTLWCYKSLKFLDFAVDESKSGSKENLASFESDGDVTQDEVSVTLDDVRVTQYDVRQTQNDALVTQDDVPQTDDESLVIQDDAHAPKRKRNKYRLHIKKKSRFKVIMANMGESIKLAHEMKIAAEKENKSQSAKFCNFIRSELDQLDKDLYHKVQEELMAVLVKTRKKQMKTVMRASTCIPESTTNTCSEYTTHGDSILTKAMTAFTE